MLIKYQKIRKKPFIPDAYSSYYIRYAHTLHTENIFKEIHKENPKNTKYSFFIPRACVGGEPHTLHTETVIKEKDASFYINTK